MNKSPGKSSLNKIINQDKKKWPWASEMWELLAPRATLDSIFFELHKDKLTLFYGTVLLFTKTPNFKQSLPL